GCPMWSRYPSRRCTSPTWIGWQGRRSSPALFLEQRVERGQGFRPGVLLLRCGGTFAENEEVAIVRRVLVVRRLGLRLPAAVARGLVVRRAVAAGVQRGAAVWALVAPARGAAQAQVDLLPARVADHHGRAPCPSPRKETTLLPLRCDIP